MPKKINPQEEIEKNFSVSPRFLFDVEKLRRIGDFSYMEVMEDVRRATEEFAPIVKRYIEYTPQPRTLESGRKTRFYIDFMKFYVEKPKHFKKLTELLLRVADVPIGGHVCGVGPVGTIMVAQNSDTCTPIVLLGEDSGEPKVIHSEDARYASRYAYIMTDVVVTGGLVAKARKALEDAGIKPLGVLAIVNRSEMESVAGLPFGWLYKFKGDERKVKLSPELSRIFQILRENGDWMTINDIRREAEKRNIRITNSVFPDYSIHVMLWNYYKKYGYPLEKMKGKDGKVRYRIAE